MRDWQLSELRGIPCSRLFDILRISVILASIIDLIFLHGIHHSILLAMVGTIILAVGADFQHGDGALRIQDTGWYTKVSSGGMGNWMATTPFPIPFYGDSYCEIPGSGGGWSSGGGPEN